MDDEIPEHGGLSRLRPFWANPFLANPLFDHFLANPFFAKKSVLVVSQSVRAPKG